MEQEVLIRSGGITLEGRYEELGSGIASLIAHPHPLYGGNMHNSVVLTMRDAFWERGISTLRFNFRGVGFSEGSFDQGVGEREDVYAAMDFLKGAGNHTLYLAGYSFGARVIVSLKFKEILPRAIILVSLPVAFMPVEGSEVEDIPLIIITGDRDEISPYPSLQELFGKRPNTRFCLIRGADHFYWNKEAELLRAILENLW